MKFKRVYVHRDVPVRLVECIRRIDFSRIRPEEVPVYLRRLEELARKKLPYRQAGSRPDMPVDIADDTPEAGIDLINRFYYGNLSRTQLVVADSLITAWIKNNLPTR